MLPLSGVQRHHFQTSRPYPSVLLKTRSTVKDFSSKKWVLDSRNCTRHATNGCSTPDHFEPLLHSTGISWNVPDFFLPCFWLSWIQWILKFYSVPLLSFSGIGHFRKSFWWPEVSLIENHPLGTVMPSNVVLLDEQSFWRRSVSLKSYFL